MNSTLLFAGLAVGILLLSVLVLVLIKQNKAGVNKGNNELASKAMGRGIAIGYAIGMGPGIAFGVALDNIGLGIALGAGIGISIGVALGESFKKKELAKTNQKIKRQTISEQTAMPKIIVLLMALFVFLLLALYFFTKMN
ncbi:hypothetical protein SLH46_12345 [Draconibacterium sp. IB214405]|uniref:hypothetical protein n=1 Tax=Draconibacterium sp. IB214405 TaxID=3097352 RepID=UPI002A111357|nr:hypothetical protein [Draconibacterium sp. IB214405]MDX8339981.1 hypothetical protein [Draconibacterium sp. IB214405]